MKIAIPTNAPGGLDATRSGHFGHCDIFTVIDVSAGHEVTDVMTLINGGHEAGGCMTPVTLLRDAGVEAIVVSGLGMRPMQGFSQAGITVYYADQEKVPNVEGILQCIKNNSLVVMHADQVCRGSANCSH